MRAEAAWSITASPEPSPTGTRRWRFFQGLEKSVGCAVLLPICWDINRMCYYHWISHITQYYTYH
jgi:hypothetical protein